MAEEGERPWLKYPSLLKYVPTALIHLLVVEMLPVWGFALAAKTAALKWAQHDITQKIVFNRDFDGAANASDTVAMIRDATLFDHQQCIKEVVSSYVFFDEPEAKTCVGCEGALRCEYENETPIIFYATWGAVLLAGCMAAVVLVKAALLGVLFKSFGSGAYIHFTWELEQMTVYKVMIYIMMLLTAFTLAVFIFDAEESAELFHFVSLFGFDCVTLLICVKKISSPALEVHHWRRSYEFDDVLFRRSWASLFSQDNDRFGTVLNDAFWRAKCGHPKKLDELIEYVPEMGGYSNVENLLHICTWLQQNEDCDTDCDGSEEMLQS
eukprot:TRINITY_DN46962_c0_g1_i1.p1 TRINITY_DN46962_c0_g1~~TRINITY_DN46962_c0_g1_i1.p1  ORF type:complete len:324 (+),score=101.29 TRINITY_DN46962_c0_g1_i1:72-1043(+)